jgi:hypothetical protein
MFKTLSRSRKHLVIPLFFNFPTLDTSKQSCNVTKLMSILWQNVCADRLFPIEIYNKPKNYSFKYFNWTNFHYCIGFILIAVFFFCVCVCVLSIPYYSVINNVSFHTIICIKFNSYCFCFFCVAWPSVPSYNVVSTSALYPLLLSL